MDETLSLRTSQWFEEWQAQVTALLQQEDPQVQMTQDPWEHVSGGRGVTRVFSGPVFEKGGVNFSHVRGPRLPDAATRLRPQLAGAPFEAMGTSIVIHPQNPFVPTVHANLRFIVARPPEGPALGWFGGGFDLTPYYLFEEDARHWHQMAKEACDTLSPSAYETYKDACDRYFYLPHRNETRGIGGIFFDDLMEPGLEAVFAFVQAVGACFIKGYAVIVARRKSLPYSDSNKAFQRYRRGRYAEFNLLYDRGTHFGLQSGGRTESILMSLPPEVTWGYAVQYPETSAEAQLLKYLKPLAWLQGA